eukprot:g33573.t1
MQDPGNLHSQHLRLVEPGVEAQSCELLPPQSLAEDVLSKATSYDTVYDVRIQDLDAHFSFEGSSFFDLPMLGLSPFPIDDPDFPLSPHVIKRRRGGIVEQRDIIKAHQAHKMQSTPQAKRKEWEPEAKCHQIKIHNSKINDITTYDISTYMPYITIE